MAGKFGLCIAQVLRKQCGRRAVLQNFIRLGDASAEEGGYGSKHFVLHI